MPVIRFPQRPRNGEPAPARPLNRKARIHGTFRSPRGGLGTMTGWLRLERFQIVSARLCAAGVFTGELLDPDGTTIGVGSRRRTVPAEIARSLHGRAVVIGPVDVDLLGLTVRIPAFTMGTGVLRRPLMKPDAERFDAKMSVLNENLTRHKDEEEQSGSRRTARPRLAPSSRRWARAWSPGEVGPPAVRINRVR